MENTSRSQLIDMKMYLKDSKSRSLLPSQCSFKAPNTFYPSLKKLDQELLVIEKQKDESYKKVKEFLQRAKNEFKINVDMKSILEWKTKQL